MESGAYPCKKHPAATIGITLTSALTFIQFCNESVGSAAKTLVIGGGLTAFDELVVNEKTCRAIMQWGQDQLRRMPWGQQAKELAALGGMALVLGGITYGSGVMALLPDANSDFFKLVMMPTYFN